MPFTRHPLLFQCTGWIALVVFVFTCGVPVTSKGSFQKPASILSESTTATGAGATTGTIVNATVGGGLTAGKLKEFLTKAFCFSGDTLVATKDGEQAIETIEAGDEVWAADPITGERKLSRVVARTMSIATALLVLNIGGEEVQATETHPFQVVGQGMTAAGNLKVGDKIERKDGESAEVESIALKVGSFPVYNLEVADAHTYFVGQQELLVHNGCDLVPDNFRWGQYLKGKIGGPPSDMVNPHAHHILFKSGNGAKQKGLVDEGQEILRKHGIDPIYGTENLTWAPNVAGQHTANSLENVVDTLRAVDQAGGDQSDIVAALQQLGKAAADRK